MPINLSKKRIIMIHGLASKPPQKDLDALWQRCIIENIRVDDGVLATQLANQEDVFLSAYWANATPHHIEDDARYVKKLRVRVDQVIKDRKTLGKKFHVDSRTDKKIKAFFKDKALDLANILTGALTIKDDVMKAFLRETELYDEDQYIADRMRQPLEDQLRAAWDQGCDIALLSHSMGTFIAYDVLWRFSHRNVPGFREYKTKRVRLLVTMGSPLSNSAIRGLLFTRHHKDKGAREYPKNIDFWHNYACLGDVVSHEHNFDEEFFQPMREVKLLPNRPKCRAVDYVKLHNPFQVVSHKGNKKREKRNPHKSYGYLVQPRLGTWLADFLRGKLRYK